MPVVWTCETLDVAAHRWTVRFPTKRVLWIGVADVRNRPAPAIDSDRHESVSVGHWKDEIVSSCSSMRAIPLDAHRALRTKVAFVRESAALRSPTTAVLCTYDAAHTMRMEIVGEPEAGAVTFPQMPAAEFLCPIVILTDAAMFEPGTLLTIESIAEGGEE
jgi:hypothetical protein